MIWCNSIDLDIHLLNLVIIDNPYAHGLPQVEAINHMLFAWTTNTMEKLEVPSTWMSYQLWLQ